MGRYSGRFLSGDWAMKRYALILGLAMCGLLFSSGLATAQTKKPNILLIVADDLGYGDVGFQGGKAVPTPNIDKLAAMGLRCSSGYVSAPYCSPSRAGLLTGRYQNRFGHEFNPHVGEEGKLGLPLEQRTIANLLRAAGYATGLVGKWHLGFSKMHHPQARGFDDFFGFLVGGHNYALRKEAEPKFLTTMSQNLIYRGREVAKVDGFATDVFTDEAIGFMKRHKEQPWFLYLAYNAVHTPLEISDKLKERVPADVKDPSSARLPGPADRSRRLDRPAAQTSRRIRYRREHAHHLHQRQRRLRNPRLPGLQHRHQHAAAGQQGSNA